MNKTSIEWTHRPETGMHAGGFTWNPIHAHNADHGDHGRTGNFCTKISPGCAHCYASRINVLRGNGLEYTVPNLEKARFYVDERELERPLRLKQPATIFVGDMFDLFHEAIDENMIARVFIKICEARQHTFQMLTKRADRMQKLFSRWMSIHPAGWPVSNLWLGVSIEDQQRADERIRILQATPAAVRFLSVEPQLEHVDIKQLCNCGVDPKNDQFAPPEMHARLCPYRARIHWVICGGESGPGARPFNLAWAESLLKQCRDAGVPFFMKQLGSYPVDERIGVATGKYDVITKDRKGGDPSEWPEHLRVREFPAPKSTEVLA